MYHISHNMSNQGVENLNISIMWLSSVSWATVNKTMSREVELMKYTQSLSLVACPGEIIS